MITIGSTQVVCSLPIRRLKESESISTTNSFSSTGISCLKHRGQVAKRFLNFDKLWLLRAQPGTARNEFVLTPAVVRGLEYYTGPVYEVELTLETKDEKGNPVRFGSVGGGGRYDGLVSRFRGQPVPATGFSIGVSRLQAALTLIGKLDSRPAPGPVLVTVFRDGNIADYQKLTTTLRNAGIRAEMYLGSTNHNLGQQLRYADRRASPCAVIQGGNEKAADKVLVRDLIAGAELAKLDQSNRDEYLKKQAEAQQEVRRGQAGRGGAPGAGPPRREVRSLNLRDPRTALPGFESLRPQHDTLRGTNCWPGIALGLQSKVSSREVAVGSPWDFAIAQTMQRHGGSNRLLPKAQPNAAPLKPVPEHAADGADADPARRAGTSPRSRRTAARRARDAFRQIAMRLPLDGKSGAIPSDALIA